MFNLKKLIIESEFARNVLTLMSGTTVAQVVPFLIAPILSRLYSPEDFDVLALFLGIINLFAPVITGTYEQAVILPKEDRDASHIIALTTTLVLVFCLVSVPIVIFLNRPITRLLNDPDVSIWLYFVPVCLFLTSFSQVFTFWFMRRKLYGKIASSRVAQSLSAAMINLGMGFFAGGASGLVLGNVVGQGLAAGVLAYPAWKDGSFDELKVSRKGMLSQAKKYINFPKYTLPQTLLDGVKDSGMIFLISSLFISGTLGSYSFTLKVLKTPLNLIGVAISQVFYQKAAETYNSDKELYPLLKDVLIKLVLIALPIFLVLVFFGPSLFAFVFGPKWEEAGSFARILAPWLLVQFISSPVSQIPLILGKQKAFLIIAAGLNLLVPVIFGIMAITTQNISTSLLVVSIITSLYLIAMIIWFMRMTYKHGQVAKI